jgi:hypothetical protein
VWCFSLSFLLSTRTTLSSHIYRPHAHTHILIHTHIHTHTHTDSAGLKIDKVKAWDGKEAEVVVEEEFSLEDIMGEEL